MVDGARNQARGLDPVVLGMEERRERLKGGVPDGADVHTIVKTVHGTRSGECHLFRDTSAATLPEASSLLLATRLNNIVRYVGLRRSHA